MKRILAPILLLTLLFPSLALGGEVTIPENSFSQGANWYCHNGFNSPLKKASLTGFHATAKHIAAKAVSPSSETMRTI